MDEFVLRSQSSLAMVRKASNELDKRCGLLVCGLYEGELYGVVSSPDHYAHMVDHHFTQASSAQVACARCMDSGPEEIYAVEFGQPL